MLTLYTAATINGRRAAIALEESGLAHRRAVLDLARGDQRRPDFLALNPAGTIPVLADPAGPRGPLTQSGAILLHCAERSGTLLPPDRARRLDVAECLALALTDIGPAASLMFHLSLMPVRDAANNAYAAQRFLRLCAQADRRLGERDWLAGPFSVADIALYPIIAARAALLAGAPGLDALAAWASRMAARQATARAMAALA